MNVVASFLGSLSIHAGADSAAGARTAGDDRNGTGRNAFAQLLSDLGGKPADPSAAAAAAGAAGTDGAASGSAQSLTDLLSQINGAVPRTAATEVPAASSALTTATALGAAVPPTTPAVSDGSLAPSRPVGSAAGQTTSAACASDPASQEAPLPTSRATTPSGQVGAKASGQDPAAGSKTIDQSAVPASSAPCRGSVAAARAGARTTLTGNGTEARRSHASDAPSEDAATTVSPATVPSAVMASDLAAMPSAQMLVLPQGAAAAASSQATLPASASAPVSAQAPGPAKIGSASATASAQTTGALPETAASSDNDDVPALLQSIAAAVEPGAATTPGASDSGPLRAVVIKQETHLPVVANGPAMQVAVAVGAELADAVGQQSTAAVSPEPLNTAGRTLVRTLTLVLTPEHLGPVSVDLRLSGGRLELSITAAHHEAAQAIERDKSALATALSGSGIDVDAVVVRTAPGGDTALGASGGSWQQSAGQYGGSAASGGGAWHGGAGGDGRQATGSQEHANGGPAPGRSPGRGGAADLAGGGLFV